VSRSEREFSNIGGYVSESTKENRRHILAMDELFIMDDDQFRQQQEDEEHQQQLEEGK
jgi:hypothetical protein